MSFARALFVYGIAGAASRLVAVVLVPLYTRMLSATEYGQLEVLLAIHALIVILAGMQIESAVMRDYFDAKSSGQLCRLGWFAVQLTFVGALFLSIIIFVLSDFGWLPGDLDRGMLLLLLGLTIPVQLLGIQQVMLRCEGRSLLFAVVSFSDLVLSALFSFVFIGMLGWHIEGALCGLLVGKSVCVIIAWRRTFNFPIWMRPEWSIGFRMLRYGLPATPAVIVSWLQNSGSRLLLAIPLALSDVAIAGVAIKVAAIYGFVMYSFRLAWEPFAMAKLAEIDSNPDVYSHSLEWYIVSMFMAAGVTVLFSPYIVAVLAPSEYAVAGAIAIFYIFGQFWVGMTNILLIGIHGSRLTFYLFPVYACGALVNVTLLLIAAPLIGVVAAGISFLAGSICSALLATYYSNKYFNTRFSGKVVGLSLIASVGFTAVWHQVLLKCHEEIHSVGSAFGFLGVGMCLIIGLLALIAYCAFGEGRPAAMWAIIRVVIRQRTLPT